MSSSPSRQLSRTSRFALRPLVLAATLALGAVTAMSANAQTAPAYVATDGTLLSVSAESEVKRVPDIAVISTGVVTQAADANGAMRANADQMAKVVAAIKAAGIADRDIQTSGVNLNPQYRYAENQPPVITGYQASNTVNLTVRDIAKLGKILDALVATGANQINGPTFDIDDKVKAVAYDEARRGAVEKAQARAEMYAKTLGMKVRRIVSISEGGRFNPPVPMMAMARMEKAGAAADTSISPGESALSVNLDVVFELGK
ncbi:SIMPL domain-containing protein [Lysobacter sp. 5GHs7-4]|uniref:SIMPL domain-containing protein n=1 Tax=Lysobacter sp. 5GHs7-4 TaxID=2904253 RepID=UPI001829C2B2|nr:SIMPL domain-containing protein [Lysobacter sp. 5GHs7-4]NUO78125.1 SIMPL domain-containing protein [Lysobacter sp.]UHQ22030.1 SIMPL domain-containing protein [Lysobacter sp. 5GHs7-4]